MVTPLWSLSLAEQVHLIRTRQLSPVELAHSILERIEACNPALLAFCVVEPERVVAQARVAESQLQAGQPLGALCGVPIGIKDLIFTRDLPTAGGSPWYRAFLPAEDDAVVERLRAAGAVILGKTNVPEFGFGPGSIQLSARPLRRPPPASPRLAPR